MATDKIPAMVNASKFIIVPLILVMQCRARSSARLAYWPCRPGRRLPRGGANGQKLHFLWACIL